MVRLNASQIGRSSSHPCTACYGCRSDPCTACYGSRSGPLQLHAMAGQTPVCTPCDCMLWRCNVHATHSMQLQVAWPALLHRPSYVQYLLIIFSLYFASVNILCCMLMCMLQAGENFFGVGGATRINPKGEGVVHTPELNSMVAG